MNDLEKMSLMAKNNQDIKMSGNILEIQKVKQGGKITLGIDPATAETLLNQYGTGVTTHYVALYIVNKNEFDKLE